MAPPAKRQKRLIVLSSDDEEWGAKSIHKPIPARSRTKKTNNSISGPSLATQPGPDVFPIDYATKLNSAGKAQTSKPIPPFYSAGTQAQPPNDEKAREPATPEAEDHEDVIVDDSPVENVKDRGGTITRTALDRRKTQMLPVHDTPFTMNKLSLHGGSQRFKVPEHASRKGIIPGVSGVLRTESSAVDMRPWTEKYCPNNLEELMVHKKKVSDVRNWLKNALRGQDRKRLLILRGPSGAGKTATISMLAKAMNVDVSEWRNPVGSESSSEAYLSMSAHLEDFLGRSGKFNTLALADTDGNVSELSSPTIDALSGMTRQRIILMEEFPNTFSSTSSALRSLQSSILEYLAFNRPSLNGFLSKKPGNNWNVPPVVMIITETPLTTTTVATDSFTAHRLLGPEILSHPGVSIIEFNPIASTYLTKALHLVIQKEARHSGRRRVPGLAVLKKLGEVGDIRCAIGSLEFLCLRGKDGDDWGGRVASRAKKRASASSALMEAETESLRMITQRESTLGFFHAVGKVVYNKRDDFADGDAPSEPLTQPPDHLLGHVRLRTAQVSADRLIDKTGTDIATFIAALHENFVLSCEGNSFSDNFDGCIDVLSDSDILGSLRGGRLGSSGDRGCQGDASDMLRQDEMCFQVAVRGLLFALPDPVKRQTHPISGGSGVKSNTYRMFYPASMRLSRQMEEIDSLVGQWNDRLQPRARAVPWGKSVGRHSRHFTHLPSRREAQPSEGNAEHRSQAEVDDPEYFRASWGYTKSELLVERLPYITKIEQRNAASAYLNGLERITVFHGFTPPGNEASEDEGFRDGGPVGDWVTDGPHEGNIIGLTPTESPQERVRQAGKAASTLVLPLEEEVRQLYLSDDDIEDG